MADKKFYWLKLNEDFYDDLTIKMIEEMDNGVKYTNFLLKLYLKSLKTEGKLMFRETIPYDEKMLGILTGVDVDIVKSALAIFLKFGMLERWDDGTLYVSEVQKMIGSESESAERVRKHREQKKKALPTESGTQLSIGLEEGQNDTPKPTEPSDAEKEFSAFWDLYAYKKNLQKCITKWKYITKEERLQIFTDLPHYIGNTFTDGRFPSRMHPLTYLNGKCWNDEPIESTPVIGSRRDATEFDEQLQAPTLGE